jgi:hypothetical protein
MWTRGVPGAATSDAVLGMRRQQTSDRARCDWKRSRKTPVSRRMTAQGRAAAAMACNWAEAFERLQSQDTPVQRRAAAAQASARVEALQKVVVQDRVADRPALPAPTSTLAQAIEKLRRLQALGEQSRTIGAQARAQRGKKQPTPSWEELEEELRRSQEALRARVAVASRPETAELVRAPAALGTFSSPQRPHCPSERLGERAPGARFERGRTGAREG